MSKNLLIGIISIVGLLVGIGAATAAWVRLENYFQRPAFIMLFAPIGFLTGRLVWKKLQRMLEESTPAELRKGTSSYGVTVGFIGFGLLFGTLVNTGISTGTNSNCIVEQKRHSNGGARSAPRYSLTVTLNGKTQYIECNYEYWNALSPGDTVRVTYNKSPIGFDFLELPDEN